MEQFKHYFTQLKTWKMELTKRLPCSACQNCYKFFELGESLEKHMKTHDLNPIELNSNITYAQK